MERCFRSVSGVFFRVFEAISKGVSNQFQGSFWRVSRKFPGVSWKFKDYFKSVMEISKVFQRSSDMFLERFMGALRKCQWCFKSVSRGIQKSFNRHSNQVSSFKRG